ncbi:MAG: diguanylate cyclase [Myxococcales bacterium]|nr:diguanylate cyclase [Myxococcales bacterium]
MSRTLPPPARAPRTPSPPKAQRTPAPPKPRANTATHKTPAPARTPAPHRAPVVNTPIPPRVEAPAAEITTTTKAAPGARSVRAMVTARKVMRRALGPLGAGAAASAMVWLESRRLAGDGAWVSWLEAGLLGGAAARVLTQVLAIRVDPEEEREDGKVGLEISVLAVAGAVGVAMRLPAGLDASYPLVLVVAAIVATFASRLVSLAAILVALVMEAGVRPPWADPTSARSLLMHGILLASFAGLNAWVLRGRLEAIAHRTRRKVERELERMREQARSYRLADAPATPSLVPPAPRSVAVEAERVQRLGVEEIQHAVRFALELLKRSLGAHTAVLLMDAGKALKLAEVVSDARAVLEGPFAPSEGVIGAVLRRKAPVSLSGLRSGYRIPYYPTALPEGGPSAIVAVPLLDEGNVRGVLCVDRLDRPFTAHEEELVASAARYVLRAIENERVFGRLERAKAEQDHLYAATQRLAGALTEAEVLKAGVESARAIASFDLAAITVVHDGERGPNEVLHEVRAVAGAADFEALVGLRFGDNGGLVAQAVKSRATLPHRGDHDPHTQVVFTRRHPLRIELGDEPGDGLPREADVRSILVVPLSLHERALGTLVLGARRRGAFREFAGEGARTTLEVLASHVATSLANARMLAKLEELATTDGLTGLLNKRVLLELGAQKVRAAARYGKALAVIQTDIDHFKRINDTHGHDVGDQVIKGLAGILRRLKRGTDYVARFGGEEFVIICEETGAEGAVQLAERVREELARTTFHAGSGQSFQVQCSLGVATHPHDGATWDELYKATDEALYASKREGRNKTTLAPGSAGRRAAG